MFLICLTIDDATLAAPLRVVDNNAAIIRTAGTFDPVLFGIQLPEEDGEQLSGLRISIDNVDKRIVDTIKSATKPTAMLEVVLASSPNTVEWGPALYTLDSFDWTLMLVTANANEPKFLSEYPAETRTASVIPELF